jgi:hypothetical protein
MSRSARSALSNGQQELVGLALVGLAFSTNRSDPRQLIRASSFFESRRWHNYGYPPDDETEAYIRVLVEKLRVLSGGAVKADDVSMVWRIRRRLHRSRK